MRMILALLACLGLSACSWLPWGNSAAEDEAAQPGVMAVEEEVVTVEEPAPAPAATAKKAASAKAPKAAKAEPAKSSKSAKKGAAKSEDQVRQELDQVAKKLTSQAKRTIMPNKANPQVRKAGGEYVASYTDVDGDHATTEMRPGKDGQYIGFIRYQEHMYECRGSSEKAARQAANCTVVKSRRVNEVIRYDGKSWQY